MYRYESNLSYFLGGIAMGSVAAIFLAPKSGRDTRRFLRRRTDYMKRRTEEIGKSAAEVIDFSTRTIQSQMKALTKAVTAVCR